VSDFDFKTSLGCENKWGFFIYKVENHDGTVITAGHLTKRINRR
jgi:hypothetical protein